MPSTPPRVTVRTAERPGSPDKPSEDRIFTTDNAVIVLDGASQPEQTAQSGGWLAEQLGSTLAGRLNARPTEDLAEALAWSIATVADAHGLVPGRSPSTTVAILRWTDKALDALVLCDSPAIVMTADSRVDVIEDTRLGDVTAQLSRSNRLVDDDPDGWADLVAAQRQQRNRPGGYWVAEANATAAYHAITTSWHLDDVIAAMAMTDGLSVGVERYRQPTDWPTAANLTAANPEHLVNLVHAIENTDPCATTWPRSKIHDDKAVAIVAFWHDRAEC